MVGATEETNQREAAVPRFDQTKNSEQECSGARDVIGTVFTYERVGYDLRPIILRGDGTVGRGSGGRELFWDIRIGNGHWQLTISSASEITCRLIKTRSGVWEGRWLLCERMPIRLYSSTQEILLPGSVERVSGNESLSSRGMGASAVKVTSGAQFTRPYRMRVFARERSNFRMVQNSRVLIYFRHGFGDWVQFSHILPLLDRTNRYWMTRFGDDYTSIMDGSAYVDPVYIASSSIHCGDGGDLWNEHFGLDTNSPNGCEQTLDLPLSVYDACVANDIDTLLHLPLPEVHGHSAYPFHSKARHATPNLVSAQALDRAALRKPLISAINLAAPDWVTNWVYARLRNYAGVGYRKLCLISRTGYTCVGKNWGKMWREDLPEGKRREGEECRDFMRLLLKDDPNWAFLIMEDALYEGADTVRSEELHSYSFTELFGRTGEATIPFGLLMKAIVNLADLSIGVPTGPYHLSMIRQDLPTVGIWIEHMPSWYDEPKAASTHILSRNITDGSLQDRPGSFTSQCGFEFAATWVNTRVITGQQVMDAVKSLVS